MSRRWLGLSGWAATLAAVAVYLVMVIVTLPHLSALAGGEPMFDLRASYDLETARTIIERLGEAGRRYYAGTQHVLDSFYPPLLALTVIYWLWRLTPRWRKAGFTLSDRALWVLMAVAALAAVFDLTENMLVGQMLDAGPDGLTAGLVGMASEFTLAKVIAVMLSQTALLVLIFGPFIPRLFRRKG